MILLVGLPGSGKSTFAKMLETGMPWKYKRINQDSLGNRRACEELCRSTILRDGKCPVIDRCNFNPMQRKHFLEIAQECNNIPVECIVFSYPMEVCIQRCESRGSAHETIGPGEARSVVERLIREFYPPLPNRVNTEEFRKLRNVTELQEANDIAMEYLNTLY
jgi:atypical dual specificity phosphatase